MKATALLATTVLLLPPTLMANEQAEAPPATQRRDAFVDERKAFAAEAFRALCGAGCAGIPIRAFRELFGFAGSSPRMLKRLLEYDPNEDGIIEEHEIYTGLTANIYFQVDRRMSLDADANGKLSLAEYALQVPDDRGERDADGFVKAQRHYFEEADLDGDGTVTQPEVVEVFSKLFTDLAKRYLLAHRAFVADQDGSGGLSLGEFLQLYGENADNPPKILARRYEIWRGKDREELTPDHFRQRVRVMKDDDIALIEDNTDRLWRARDGREQQGRADRGTKEF